MTIRYLLLLPALFFSSCAYVQTHRNVEESFYRYGGYSIPKDISLYKSGDTYYVAVQEQELRKHYARIHDTIMFTDYQESTFCPEGKADKTVYIPISSGTAAVLQREDGYASPSVLRDELQQHQGEAVHNLSHASGPLRLRAQISETTQDDDRLIVGTRRPDHLTIIQNIITQTDKVVVDWPGTIVYNCMLPVAAPFRFFYEFLNDDNEEVR